jgi:hypothetical protein
MPQDPIEEARAVLEELRAVPFVWREVPGPAGVRAFRGTAPGWSASVGRFGETYFAVVSRGSLIVRVPDAGELYARAAVGVP